MAVDWNRPGLRALDPAVRDALQRLVAEAEEHGMVDARGHMHLGRTITDRADEAAGRLGVRLVTPLAALGRFPRTLSGPARIRIPAAWLRSLLAQVAERDGDPRARRLAARCARGPAPMPDVTLPLSRATWISGLVESPPGTPRGTELICPPLVLRFRVEGGLEEADEDQELRCEGS